MKVAQSCPTLCNPMGYTVHGILQARILEWVAIPFSRGSSQPRFLTFQAYSLPVEPQGKPNMIMTPYKGPCPQEAQFNRRVIVQLLSHVRLFVTLWTAPCQASLSFTISLSLLKLMSIEFVMPSNHLILCRPLLLPAPGSFLMSWSFLMKQKRHIRIHRRRVCPGLGNSRLRGL